MKGTDTNPTKRIEGIKVKAIKLIFSFFLLISLTALFIYLFNIVVQGNPLNEGSPTIFFIVTVITVFVLFFVRSRINLKNYKIFFLLTITVLSIILIIIAVRSGVYSMMVFPILATLVIVLTVVLDMKKAQIFTLVLLGVLMSIGFLHNFGVIDINPTQTGSDIASTVIFFLFIWVILELAKLGFSQIEEYYENAYSYAKELEALNRELDEKVRERTAMLQQNFNNQIQDMYNSATIGNITKPLLHDLATPISVILGSIDLMEKKKKFDLRLIDIIKTSADEMKKMIDESKDLMRNKDAAEIFNITDHVDKAVKIIKNELNKYEIELEYTEINPVFIQGIPSIFERIIINLIVNAIEELKNKKDARKIRIEIKEEGNFVFVIITDNGRGIKKEHLKKIFMEDFSLKYTTHNLGLGLPFVKKMMSEVFKGEITADSVEGEYTSFILKFNIYRDEENVE